MADGLVSTLPGYLGLVTASPHFIEWRQLRRKLRSSGFYTLFRYCY